jgi:hypothetical protein
MRSGGTTGTRGGGGGGLGGGSGNALNRRRPPWVGSMPSSSKTAQTKSETNSMARAHRSQFMRTHTTRGRGEWGSEVGPENTVSRGQTETGSTDTQPKPTSTTRTGGGGGGTGEGRGDKGDAPCGTHIQSRSFLTQGVGACPVARTTSTPPARAACNLGATWAGTHRAPSEKDPRHAGAAKESANQRQAASQVHDWQRCVAGRCVVKRLARPRARAGGGGRGGGGAVPVVPFGHDAVGAGPGLSSPSPRHTLVQRESHRQRHANTACYDQSVHEHQRARAQAGRRGGSCCGGNTGRAGCQGGTATATPRTRPPPSPRGALTIGSGPVANMSKVPRSCRCAADTTRETQSPRGPGAKVVSDSTAAAAGAAVLAAHRPTARRHRGRAANRTLGREKLGLRTGREPARRTMRQRRRHCTHSGTLQVQHPQTIQPPSAAHTPTPAPCAGPGQLLPQLLSHATKEPRSSGPAIPCANGPRQGSHRCTYRGGRRPTPRGSAGLPCRPPRWPQPPAAAPAPHPALDRQVWGPAWRP